MYNIEDLNIKGTRKFPKFSIINDNYENNIAMKKIIIKAGLVIKVLRVWSSRIKELSKPNSKRIIIPIEGPIFLFLYWEKKSLIWPNRLTKLLLFNWNIEILS